MKNSIIYITLIILLSSLCSCSLKETYTPVTTEGTVEFVPRLSNFNGVNVSTKSTDNVETAIYNAYLLLFKPDGDAGDGGLISSIEIDTDNDGNEYPQKVSTKLFKDYSYIYACYIANVPKTFVANIHNKSDLSTAVLDLDYADNSNGIPLLNLGNNSVPAIPMFGMDKITDLSPGSASTIPVKRLFAKVTLKLTMDLKDIGTLGRQRNTFFQLNSHQLNNIPKKVYLCAPADGTETIWDESYYYGPSTTITSETKIYNQDALLAGISKEYSFDYYVPEYYLLPLSQSDTGLDNDKYGQQEYKPSLAGEKKAIYIKLIGNFDPAEGDAVGMEYDIYLGENSTTNFTLRRNKHYTNNVKITGIDNANAEIDNRVTITTENDLVNIYGEVANCYAISSAGEYTIKAYKGAYKYSKLKDAPKCTGTSVEIIAQDKAGVTFADSKTPFVVSEEDGIKTIRFNVTEISNDCNIVIAMMKDGAIEWSWHLWFIKDLKFGNQGFFQLGIQEMPNSDRSQMVDRNLGVIRAIDGQWIGGTATGFYYKYGQHVPYLDIDGDRKYSPCGGGKIDDSKPTWNTVGKSATDPCPPGYKVPSKNIFDATNGLLKANDPITNSFIYSSGIYYPYSGFIDASNTITEGDTSNGEIQNPLKNLYVPENQNLGTIYSEPNYPPIKCSSVEYKTIDLDKSGYVLTTSSGTSDLFKYYYKEDGFELTKCTYVQGTWKKKWLLVTYYVAEYSSSQNKTPITKTGAELKAESPALYEAVMQAIKDESNGFLGGIWDSITGFFDWSADITWTSVDDNCGYQVRCVKE